MFATLRRQYAQLVTSALPLFLLLIGWHVGTRQGWLYSLGAMAAISLFTWLSALRRLRLVRDTPTSKVASAAQGYVELIGTGKPYADMPVISHLTQLPCLWYRYQIERQDSDDKWQTEDRGESEESFLLHDDSGWCVVDPCGAEIVSSNKKTWRKGEYRYTEWTLLQDEMLYAIGEFNTLNGSVALNAKEETKIILDEWKQDMKSLHARFDLNQDGVLDLQEWELARHAAQREAEKRITQACNQQDTHYLSQAQDRLYLISNLPPEKLAQRYAMWTWAHLAMLLGALGGLAWVLGH